ncbi:MAG: DUF2993 domain-containing protein [Actinobacteria bacterium]|nr:DUF2993 domain-containing protein [Actinomycetota bacterium]
MRRVLYLLVTLLALALLAEVALTVLVQRGMERALARRYGLPDDLEVAVGAFPFLVSLARERIGELRLSWRGECLLSHAGGESAVTYHCVAYLYDVEVSFASLLRGDLQMRSLSRVDAHLDIPLTEAATLLGVDDVTVTGDGGLLVTSAEGGERRYGVRVIGDDGIAFSTDIDSGGPGGVSSEPVPQAQGGEPNFRLSGLPMEAKAVSATIDGDRIVIEISIPEWVSYLEYSTTTSDFKHEYELYGEVSVSSINMR